MSNLVLISETPAGVKQEESELDEFEEIQIHQVFGDLGRANAFEFQYRRERFTAARIIFQPADTMTLVGVYPVWRTNQT